MKMAFDMTVLGRPRKNKRRWCHDGELPCSSLSCFGIFMQMPDQNSISNAYG